MEKEIIEKHIQNILSGTYLIQIATEEDPWDYPTIAYALDACETTSRSLSRLFKGDSAFQKAIDKAVTSKTKMQE